ncbi:MULTISPECIES: hypothetical protein [unclassified Streptomyces]|uniref:hypothetical protein n=1 Tax=unclassified Streptomyces TaxID=2593676 RepID=UPI0007F4D350|nr:MULTISPECIES: hypothetical protein [unclassified Streptomyces]MCM1972381.1 hypothetical protein [Streptomyces sp. G1]SBT89233.1 hypothetical protein GA0115233_10085 [Streptomyces sp. DI166]
MPFPPPSRPPSGPRRRSLFLSAAGAVLLAGCSSAPDTGGTGGSPSAADRARTRAARDSADLLVRYDAVIAAHPPLAERLRPLRAEVVRHVAAFGGTGRKSPAPSKPAPSRSASAAPPVVPTDEKAALAELAAAERALADARTETLTAVPGELARLLASVAAAGAAHVYLLTEGEA